MKRIAALILSVMTLLGTVGLTAVPANAACASNQATVSLTQADSMGKLQSLFTSGSSARVSTKAWLPDPCNAFGVQGEYAGTQAWNGMNYSYYIYQKDMTIEEASDCEILYTYVMKKEGFQELHMDDPNVISYVCFTKNGSHYAELALNIIGNDEALDYGGAATWQIILAVPEDLSFYPGKGSDYIYNDGIRCDVCEGDKTCHYCIGGRANYGAGLETCVICEGSNVCNVCDGMGHW